MDDRRIVRGTRFLPVNLQDMAERGWDRVDFAFVSGDAYVDHPSFGHAIISRVLEAEGFRVGIIAQPDWRTPKDFLTLGRPRIGVLVSSGNLDSMVCAYTAARKKRSEDAYSPGGEAGKRPDRATIVYCNRIRELWGDIPLVIGGIEASLRRFSHYDYWSDSLRRSMLVDSRADLLVYGMGERPIREIATRLRAGENVRDIRDVRGTCYRAGDEELPFDSVELPSFEETVSDPAAFTRSFQLFSREQDPVRGRTLRQKHGLSHVVQNPPAALLSEAELDAIYELPYVRTYHPQYENAGGVPAIREVQFSLVTHRGCFGGCAFCSLFAHQGRIIQMRSDESILREAILLTELPDFKGIIHDVGGPTANFCSPSCSRQLAKGTCADRECIGPEPCPHLRVDHERFLNLLRRLRTLPGVRKVFVRSGLRYDYILLDRSAERIVQELCKNHVSGQLKVAPEHASRRVTEIMGKPDISVFRKFRELFFRTAESLGMRQFLVPYLMSSHPGCALEDAIELALFVKEMGYTPEQVQDFMPTPGSLSTCIYYTGVDPRNGTKVTVVRGDREKRMQRALMQFARPENHRIVEEALRLANREDLIGKDPSRCLIRNGTRAGATDQRAIRRPSKNRADAFEPRAETNSRAPSTERRRKSGGSRRPSGK